MGGPPDTSARLLRGAFALIGFLATGGRQIGSFYLPGDIFALEVDHEHHFSAEAIADSTVVFVKRGALLALANRDGSIAYQLWSLTAQQLQRVQEHAGARQKRGGARRFFSPRVGRPFVCREMDLAMSRQDIADYLGPTTERVSRVLTQFRSAATIAVPTSRRIELLNRPALVQLNA